jgi:hypothetical protein
MLTDLCQGEPLGPMTCSAYCQRNACKTSRKRIAWDILRMQGKLIRQTFPTYTVDRLGTARTLGCGGYNKARRHGLKWKVVWCDLGEQEKGKKVQSWMFNRRALTAWNARSKILDSSKFDRSLPKTFATSLIPVLGATFTHQHTNYAYATKDDTI